MDVPKRCIRVNLGGKEYRDKEGRIWLADKEYTKYDFIITQMGEGFLKDWNVQVIRRPEP